MKKNKFFLEYAAQIASFLSVAALLLFVPASMTPKLGMKIFLGVMIAIFLIAGVVIIYVAHRAKGERVHYFLYDRRRDRKLHESELSAELVREGVAEYLQEYLEEPLELWADIPKRLRIQLQQDHAFRPLISFYMLLTLSECEDAVSVFEGADPRAVGYLCSALHDARDAEMAEYIFKLKKSVDEGEDPFRVATFLSKNHRLFADRMLRFVERNMSEFYMEKSRIAKINQKL